MKYENTVFLTYTYKRLILLQYFSTNMQFIVNKNIESSKIMNKNLISYFVL